MRPIRFRWLILIALLTIVLMPVSSWARQVGCFEAKIVAENFLNQVMDRHGGWGEAEDAYIQDCKEFKEEDGRLLGYFLPVHPRGYIMVSLLTQLPAVKAYSWENDLDLNAEGGATRLLKDMMGSAIEYLETVYGSLDRVPEEGVAPKSNSEEWDFLSGKGPAPLDASGSIPDSVTTGPLTGTTWAQGGPYNNNCPAGDGGTTLVGCVATAAAQIMKYWNYPSSGTGDHTYAWNGDQSCGGNVGGGNLSATFSDSYDWANMLNSYPGGETAAQIAAAAELSYEVGVAFDMDYGVCASSAYTSDAATVFPTYFKYSPNTAVIYRPDYATADAWFAEIRKEFDSPLPRLIQYRIARSGWGGHSIVCDGYQTGVTNYFHMNYGWSGSNNLWYAVDNLYCPDVANLCPTSEQYMVTGIQPPNRRYVAVKGATNNNIYYGYWTSLDTFSTFYTPTGGSTSHAPAMAVFNNRQYMVVKGATNNNIYITSKDYKGDWTSWTQISGTTSTSPALAVFNNRLYLFVKGATNTNIYYRSMDASGAWNSWSTGSGGTTSDTPALAVFSNKLWLFCKGAANNNVYYTALSDTEVWEAWRIRLGAATSAGPAVAVNNFSDTVYLFMKGAANNNIYYYTAPASTFAYSWNGFYTVPGQTSTTPSLTYVPETVTLFLAVKGATNNNIYHCFYDQIETMWTSWVTMSGRTSDTPVLNTYYFYGSQDAANLQDSEK